MACNTAKFDQFPDYQTKFMKKDSPAPAPKISQQRIAKDLGLSQALVSMVLNGRTEGISADSQRRIWDHAVALGYQPKGMLTPSGGAPAKPIHVGFILRGDLGPHKQSNYFSLIQNGLHEVLQEKGISTVFLGTENQLNAVTLRTTLASQKAMLGVVIMGEVAPAFLKAVKQVCPRVVAASISYPGLCHSVQSNENQSLDLLVEHLVGLGHRRLGWIGGNRALVRHADRYRAFRAALAAHGLEFDENWVLLQDGADRLEGGQAAEQFLAKSGPRPTAVVCFSAPMARGAINLWKARGLKIPEDLSVVAVDSTRVCTEESPLITGASANPEAMGRKVAELLLSASNDTDEVFMDVCLPSRLTVRETSAAPKADA